MPETTWSDGDVATATLMNQIEDQLVITCLSSSRPTGAEGRYIFETDTNRRMFYDGSSWVIDSEPAQSWTPTITQSGTVSGTTNLGWYRRERGTFEAYLKWTSSGAGTASNQITVTTPVTLSDLEYVWGTFLIVDASPATNYVGSVSYLSTTTFRFFVDGSSSALGASALTLASGDIIRCHIGGRFA